MQFISIKLQYIENETCISTEKKSKSENIYFLPNVKPSIKGKGPATKSDEFSEKCQRGGGVIFSPKTYVADFGNFKQGFLVMKLIQNSNSGS